jgi:hypothetical protein
MKDLIEEHLEIFSALYLHSEWGVRLHPKHHMLVNLPSIVLKSGPLVGMSCMKYVMKNSFFKRYAHTVCNFTNICLTLAHRHQQRCLQSLLSGSHIRDAVHVAHPSNCSVFMLPFSSLLCSEFNVESTDNITLATKLNVGTLLYAEGNCVIVDYVFDNPEFGKIIVFVSVNATEWFTVVEILKTTEFSCHYHSYVVTEVKPPQYKLCSFKGLIDHHPLQSLKLTFNTGPSSLIRLPYHTFK